MTVLTAEQIQTALQSLPEWQLTEAGGVSAIEKRYRFADFLGAMAFVNNVAQRAEAAGHHPDISISYNRVTLTLTTHDAGGVTDKDIQMAAGL